MLSLKLFCHDHELPEWRGKKVIFPRCFRRKKNVLQTVVLRKKAKK